MKIALIVGHTKESPGARGATGLSEYEYNNDLATLISCIASWHDNEGFIIKKDHLLTSHIKGMIDDIRPSCVIELHANAFDKTVFGTEVLYTDNNVESYLLANCIYMPLIRTFGRKGKSERGLKYLLKRERGYDNLMLFKRPACLIEPGFIDNPEDEKLLIDKKSDIARVIYDGIIEFNTLRGA